MAGSRPAFRRRFPVGAEVTSEGTHFRVWAPKARRLEVVLEEGGGFALQPEAEGYFSGLIPEARAGMGYWFRIDSGGRLFPDPASRFQPKGPHGPSQIVDPGVFQWGDHDWRGISREGQVLYEMHVGTFTEAGTWEAAAARIGELARIGVTTIEVMPVAEFQGNFGWGYDGVALFAPTRLYGSPDDFRAFVDVAHRAGAGVILDVVYNHVGPDGNYLKEFSGDYFTDRYKNEWGEPINFDGPNSGPVREFFAANAAYWVAEFHLDGLRLDATQQIFDKSDEHILRVIAREARRAGGVKATFLVAENEPQHARLARPAAAGGFELDALWNDDFHHAAHVALTGMRGAYYSDYKGSPQELVSAVKHGFLFQGQYHRWQKQSRGAPALDLRPEQFIQYLQNHDQVANSLDGRRIHQLSSPGKLRAMTALLLLSPATPMLFQGQEFAASAPFLYFAGHNPELARAVREGRGQFLRQFPSLNSDAAAAAMAAPERDETFLRCKLDWSEREKHAWAWCLHEDLLRLRREERALRGAVDGAVLSGASFVLRFFHEEAGDRLLVVNLGADLDLIPAPEPLLAPPEGLRWTIQWSSEDIRYGGGGTPPFNPETGWRLPAESAMVLEAQ